MSQEDDRQKEVLEKLGLLDGSKVVAPNVIRRQLGIQPLPFMHSYYHIDGQTDLAKMKSEAEKRRLKGEASKVHQHKAGDFCNSKCENYRPVDKDGGDNGG